MALQLDIITQPRMNLALLQNNIPLIRSIQFFNNGGQSLESLKVKISSDPDGILMGEFVMSQIGPGETVTKSNPEIRHSWEYFANVVEKIRGRIFVEVIDESGFVLLKSDYDLEIEPLNTWLGQQAPLELLASHVMPNSAAVQKIIKKASDILREKTDNSALNGYQSKDRKRVHQIAQSIVQAIRTENITYAEPPASFEESGQKVRTPDKILQYQMATCLDVSLFYQACLEQSGIHSLLFLVQGHAFVGFWLEDKFLQRPIEDDPQFFRKRIELDEMAVVDITGATMDGQVSFSQMEKSGKDFFQDEDKFVCGVDLSHCRKFARIYPLNDKQTSPEETELVKQTLKEDNRDLETRAFKNFEISEEDRVLSKELDKWKDKLLDLSFRNRLLNFRSNKGTVEILCQNPAEIEDVLAGGLPFELLCSPTQSKLNEQRSDLKEIIVNQITENFQRKKLLTRIPEDKFQSILNNLNRSVINTEEETGVNTLFLTLGVLEWKESDNSDVVRKSPLLLLPVTLKKKSVGGKFTLSIRDDDTILNHTLLQKLFRDFNIKFPGLDPLPEDESGVDVEKILGIIQKVIRDNRGWEVKGEVWLSEFSFQKFLMWKELDNNFEEMLASPIIRRLMTSETSQNIPDFITEDKVESIHHPKDIFCPLSADSSQMAAILSAANGSSFVLQGPPGTGKSQTIANMIAHCIGIGKKVLFVSEKKVALEVVYRRLKEIGIGPFCLELHSKKSEKKEVVKSFHEALDYVSPQVNGAWNQVADELKTSRDELNEYFKELHKVSSSGISAFKAFGIASRKQGVQSINLDLTNFLEYPSASLNELKVKLRKWQALADELNDEEYQAWALVQKENWTSKSEDLIFVVLNALLHQIKSLQELIVDDSIKFELNKNWKASDWKRLPDLIESILAIPKISSTFLNEPDFEKYKYEFEKSIDLLGLQFKTKESIDKEFLPQIYKENLGEFKRQFDQSREGFFIGKFFRKLKLKGVLKKLVKSNVKEIDFYDNILDSGIAYQENMTKEEEAAKFVENAIGEKFTLGQVDDFQEAINWAATINQNLKDLYSSDFESYNRIKAFLKNVIDYRTIFLSQNNSTRLELEKIQAAASEFKLNIETLCDELVLSEVFLERSQLVLKESCNTIRNTISLFKDAIVMNGLKREFCESGLAPLFELVDSGTISKSGILEVFNFNFHRQWLEEKNAKSNLLNSTTGHQLNNLDADFKNSDSKYRSLSEKALSAIVAEGRPVRNSFVLPNSPVGLIQKEYNKSRKHLPIRRFLGSINSIAKNLKPCYMMSPMSVSQYLPVAAEFDIVIFDEASQIPPWDAIGALSRGKQAVIVGDTKQLPPTSFFSNDSDSESDEDEKIDCESVLEMFGSLYPEMLLKWHYRSRSESLISFSNYHIYDNRLHTFPASNTNDHKVSLEIVKGKDAYYDRSKSRTNLGEAKAVVREIFHRLKDRSTSIGVVTFSTAQASLINDLIDKELQTEPRFENSFDAGNSDYVFVKSIENVQGDERDLILFSVGYGKDANGKISKNFGPLNNSGGERRLNVAVTRARFEVKIFSNFEPREFDTSGSKSEGLRLLKEYLLYAKEGQSTFLKQERYTQDDEFDSPFEKEVAVKLRSAGWQVQTQIGVGGYRIDLGIVHPDYPGRFLAGIECDGARYHSARSARDRDILRQAVLEGLDWNILRIWSTDWWYDSSKCIVRLEEQLNELRLHSNVPETFTSAKIDEEKFEESFEVEEEEELQFPRYDPTIVELKPAYDFFDNRNLVSAQILEVVHKLGPISKEECYTIVSKAWGFAKKGSRIMRYLESCAPNIHETSANGQVFLWSSAEEVNFVNELRVPVDGEQRHPKAIAPQELKNGILTILKSNIEVPKEQLLKRLAQMLGFSRITTDNLRTMDPAIELLISSGEVVCEGDLVRLV